VGKVPLVLAVIAIGVWLLPQLVALLWAIGLVLGGGLLLGALLVAFLMGLRGGDDDLDAAAYFSSRR
jgi:hypothetical protein